MTDKPENYYSFSEKVGSVKVDDLEFQLCDHVQKIEGNYFATAFTKADKSEGKDDGTGIYYKRISSANLAFLPLEKLQKAQAVFDDHNQTNEMKTRLINAITSMSETKYKDVV